MRHGLVLVMAALIGLGASRVASATQVTTGPVTITTLTQYTAASGLTAGTFSFQVAGQPDVTQCGGRGSYFIVSSNSIPDAQTRINLYALLLTAYATGAQVSAVYDNAGAFCDQAGIGVYYVNAP